MQSSASLVRRRAARSASPWRSRKPASVDFGGCGVAARTTGAESAAKEAEAPLGRAGSGAQGGQQPDRLDGEYLSRSFGDNLPLLDLLLRQFLEKSLPEIERGLADEGFILVSAPAGYGKTTLVSEWAQQSQHPFLRWLAF